MFVCRVLVVDDNTHIHRDFKKIVDTVDNSGVWGADPLGPSSMPRLPAFELSSATSGEAAIDMVSAAAVAKRAFHVAFVDMRMPGCDGLTTVEKLWLIQPELEVAFSSAYMDHSWSDVTARLGRPGLRSVPKPWTGSQVLAVLHELRGRARDRTLRIEPTTLRWSMKP
jgi:two-component system, NtrC family, sensor kinase